MTPPSALTVRDHRLWAVTAQDAVVAVGGRDTGLSAAEAAERLVRWGPNALPEVASPSLFVRFGRQFRSSLIYVLLGSVVLASAVGEYLDAGVILAVVLVNAVVGFVQESHAEGALAALAAMTETTATVVRDGEPRRVPSFAVTTGDLVLLDAGSRVPADLRLVETHELRADESALTGESAPAEKGTAVVSADTALNDRTNMAHSGTLITDGSGTGVVAAIGANTQLGLIDGLVRKTVAPQTPLTRKIARFSRVITLVVLVLGAATFAIGLVRGRSLADMSVAAIALAVGAIPEGLPAMVTITLAFGVARMVRRGVIVRRLPVVETLGGTTVICTDKTGTLTENRMTVTTVVRAAGSGNECLTAGLACNDGRLMPDGEVAGDPTEVALLRSAAKAGITRVPRRLDTIPFTAERRYMATLHPGVVYAKGSAERILGLCDTSKSTRNAKNTVDRLGRDGLRVLAFARADVAAGTEVLDEEHLPAFTFLGLQGMFDPPREASAAAIHACQDAGIQVKMITGDHATTAQAIGARVGLDGPVVSGTDLASCPDDLLPALAGRTTIFARVSPAQKLRLVTALQDLGHVVAMTGDGVNDAPALKRADIGVAMGRDGTEVAKDSADMVLTDDDFASIQAAVEEGRGVFDNLTRFIVWALPANLGLGLVLVAAIVTGTALPLLPLQVLWLNMTAVLVIGLPFTMERAGPGLMRRPPRDPEGPLITAALGARVALVSGILVAGAFALLHWELAHGASAETARTVVVNMFAFTLMTYLFNCLSLDRPMLWTGARRNPSIVAAVPALVGLQLLYTYVPVMNRLFGSAPLTAAAWGRVAVVAGGSYAVIEVVKAIKHPARRP